MPNNPNLGLGNINAYTNFGQILSVNSQDIERKQKSDICQRAIALLQMCEKSRSCQYHCIYKFW